MKNNAAKKRKQVPAGYLVVGVDPHKKKHAAVFMTQDFMTRSKLKFDNSREGFEKVLERARTEMLNEVAPILGQDRGDIKIGFRYPQGVWW